MMTANKNVIVGRFASTGVPVELVLRGEVLESIRRIDTRERDLRWVAPGLVDLQVNGFGGEDPNDPEATVDTVIRLRDALRMAGTTSFVPTIVTNPSDSIEHALAMVAEATRVDPTVREAIPYIHLEGPYISPIDGPRGCHAIEDVHAPDLEEFERWQSAADGLIGMLTLSPHWKDSASFISAVSARGVRVAVGHTHASGEDIRRAVDAGARFSTHLGNGAEATLPRHPNYIWTQLADDDLTAGFIGDGHHLPMEVLTVMLRAKGIARSFVVSDSAALAGEPAGLYHSAVGGDVEVTEDGRLVEAGTPYLAGSAACLGDCLARMASRAVVSFSDAVRLTTQRPGSIADPRGTRALGRLVRGRPASVVTFEWQPGDDHLRDVEVAGR